MKERRTIALFLVWLIVGSGLSLKAEINGFNELLQRADSLQKARSNESLPLLYACLKQLKEAKPHEELKLYKLLSNHYLKREEMDSSMVYCIKRYELAKKLDADYDEVMAGTDLGELYGKQGAYQKAFQYLTEARELSKTSQDAKVQARIMSNQAYLYYLFEKKEASIELLKNALLLYEQVKDTMNLAYINNNLGILYKNKGQLDSAAVYLEQAYIQSRLGKDTLGMASACNNLGNVLAQAMNSEEAIDYLEQSLEYYTALNREELSLYSNLGLVYTQLDNDTEALHYLKKALEVSEKQKSPKTTMDLLNEIANYYAHHQQWADAYQYQQQYLQLKEQTYDTELPEIIDRIQAEADIKVKEKTISLLTEKNTYQGLYIKQKNRVIVLLIVVLLIGGGLGYSLYSRRKVQSMRREALMEQRLLRSQMNPHFFFNTLSVIQSFVIRNDGRIGAKYLAKFARLMREILENSARNKITLHQEISATENYLSLQQLRMNNNFEYTINVDEGLNPLLIEIPPMLFQPFIENAIDHGFNHLKDRKGFLEINFSKKDEMLLVCISDNGIGRKQSALINASLRKNHQSMGTNITEERLNLMAGDKKGRSYLSIEDRKNNEGQMEGTLVKLLISL